MSSRLQECFYVTRKNDIAENGKFVRLKVMLYYVQEILLLIDDDVVFVSFINIRSNYFSSSHELFFSLSHDPIFYLSHDQNFFLPITLQIKREIGNR